MLIKLSGQWSVGQWVSGSVGQWSGIRNSLVQVLSAEFRVCDAIIIVVSVDSCRYCNKKYILSFLVYEKL